MSLEPNGRNFPSFIDAYMEYAEDGFCPNAFHYWTCMSILAGALERKVWLKFEAGRALYPNLYIFLVSSPGVGKSSAGRKGVTELLRELPDVKFIPSQITEARLIELMSEAKTFEHNGAKLVQSAGYFYASEASNSLKEVHGNIISCFTDFYDCDRIWEKGTVKDGERRIYNLCFNMLAGCTFNYLGILIPEENIMGGFASRNLFVVHDEPQVRAPKWGKGGDEHVMRQRLLEDLAHIHMLSGPFSADAEFIRAYEDWFPEHDRYVQSLNSEKMQAFLARKHINVLKLAMILAISESDELMLGREHWDRAMTLVTELERKLPKILNVSATAGVESQASINEAILRSLTSNNGVLTCGDLRRLVFLRGYRGQHVESTLDFMRKSGIISQEITGNEAIYRLLIDPNKHL